MSKLDLINEYLELGKQEKLIKKRKSEISKELKTYAKTEGNKDQNGSYYKQDGDFIVGNVARKSVRLNQEKALSYFTELKLKDRVVDIQETVNEDKVEALLEEGLITPEDLEDLVDISTSYAISVKEVKPEEEMPEVEQKEIKKENSTKKRKSLKKVN